MIRLKNILREQLTFLSNPIEENEFWRIYENKVNDYDPTSGTQIYRGTWSEFDYAITNPKGRSSAHTDNYYTLIINNSSNWQKYPNREIICTTNDSYAQNYGYKYHVIPLDGTDWGVCSDRDIWSSFESIRVIGFDTMDDFNRFLTRVVQEHGTGGRPEENYSNFVQVFNNISEKLSEGYFFDDLPNVMPEKFFWEQYKKSEYFENNKLGEFIVDLLDPNRNDFVYLESWSDNKVSDDQEVWTDKDCLIVSDEKYQENKDRL